MRGQAVEVITGTFQGQPGSMYIATHGKPYIIRVAFTGTKTTPGITVDLTNFNKAVHTTTPKGAVTQ